MSAISKTGSMEELEVVPRVATTATGLMPFATSASIASLSADASILYYRLQTDDLGSMMPDIGRSVIHTEGVDLMRVWIDGMEPVDCEG